MKIKHKQSGFAHIMLVLLVVAIAAIGGVGYYVATNQKAEQEVTSDNAVAVAKASETKIKHLGVNLDYYDKETNKAGDFVFTKDKLEFNRLFFEYGFVVPATSAGPEKKEPATYIYFAAWNKGPFFG